LIAWNASIVGVVLGKEVIDNTRESILSGLYAGFARFLGLIPHGIFEIMAYFVAGISGTLLSAAIMHRRLKLESGSILLGDSFILFLIAFVFLVFGAVIEAVLF
jgi:uncharacterized membrane protein SpoIIM required for sporulation